MRLPDPIANTTTEAYLAYKAGVLSEGDLKPKLYDPYIHLDAWLAYWTGLVDTYPTNKDGEPEMLTDEEAYIAYLSGVTDTYPEEFRDPADIRVAAYLRYLISARFGRPEYPVTNEELYLSMQKPPYVPSGDPSSDITIDGTAKAPFVDIKMYGDTSQTTYTGKNMFNLVTPNTNNGVTVTANADGSFTLNGTTTGVAVFNFILPVLKPAGTYTISCTSKNQVMDSGFFVRARNKNMGMLVPGGENGPSQIKGEGTNYAEKTFISTDSMYCLALNLTTTGVTYNNMIIYPQVEVGSTATSFEPYVGGVPAPNPDYPQAIQTVTGEQTVEIVGKNLSPNIGALAWSSNNISNRVIRDDEMTFTTSTSANFSGVYLNKTTNYDICKYYYESGYIVSFEVSASEQTNFIVGQSGGTQTSYTVGTTPVRISATTGDANFVFYAIDKNGASVTIKNIQLEAGSTATAYAPYSKNTYPINLGKNLLDSSSYTDGYINQDGGVSSGGGKNALFGTIKVSPSTKYTMSAISSTRFSAAFFNSGSIISRDTNHDGTSYTFTTPANCNELRCWVWKTDGVSQEYVNSLKLQFEAGSQATTYAPYFTPIELCKLGDYQDYIYKDGEDWKVHKAISLAILTGSNEDWRKSGNASNVSYFYASNNNTGRFKFSNIDTSAIGTSSSSKVVPPILANNFGAVYPANIFTDRQAVSMNSNSGGVIELRLGMGLDTNITTASLLTSWLATNNINVYYPLATAVDTVITNQNLIDQLEALVNGGAEEGTTYIKVSATDPNLPGLLYVEAPKYE